MSDIVTQIKERISITEYLTAAGYHFERHGGRGLLKLKEHDSFILDPQKNRFWWNSHDIHGSVIDLVVELEGVTQQEAIKRLSARLRSSPPLPQPQKPDIPAPARCDDSSQRVFVLPKPEPKYWPRVYGYLIKERCIDPEIVKWLEKSGLLYPTDHANLCYLSQGYDGKPDYAAEKGTVPGGSFRRVVENGNFEARAAFHLIGQKPTAWIICEAAVDCWSMMTMLKQRGADWTKYAFLSLESCYSGPLRYHLAHSQPPAAIYLAQDNDEGGMKSRAGCRALLAECGYAGRVIDKLPPLGKDWNDTLRMENGRTLQTRCAAARTQAEAVNRETERNPKKEIEREMNCYA